MIMAYQVLLEKDTVTLWDRNNFLNIKDLNTWISGKVHIWTESSSLEPVLYFFNLSYKNMILDEIQK